MQEWKDSLSTTTILILPSSGYGEMLLQKQFPQTLLKLQQLKASDINEFKYQTLNENLIIQELAINQHTMFQGLLSFP